MSKLPDVVDNGIPMTLGGLQGHSAIASFFKSDFSHSLPSVGPGADPGHVQAVRWECYWDNAVVVLVCISVSLNPKFQFYRSYAVVDKISNVV